MSRAPRSVRVIGIAIGPAASQLGIHPQTLREYERQGLVSPNRTQGGSRRYGAGELARLQRIQALTAEGLSLAGVRHVLHIERELADARARVTQLEQQLGLVTDGPDAEQSPVTPRGTAMLRRSMSVELVHIPRERRGPRWRNID